MNLNREGYTLLWKMENFSSAWHRLGEKIESPVFTLDAIERTQWRLLLYPKGKTIANNIAYYLKRYEYSKGPNTIEIHFEFSFLTEDGAVLQPSVALKDTFKKGEAKGTCQFKTREEIFLSKCLSQDILTTYCRIWISGRINMESVKIFANTVINVDRLSFEWNIENFSKIGKYLKNVYEIKSVLGDHMVTLELFSTEDSYDELINICIKSYNPKVRYFKINFFLLDSARNRTNCGQLDFRVSDLLEDGKIILAKKRDLVRKKDSYLPNDILSLNCECDFPTNCISAGIVKTDRGIPYSKFGNETKTEEKLRALSIGLTDALRSMYSEKLFCDVNLCTSTHTFSVHKSILSSRSSVFKEMFRKDMNVKTMNSVDISDVDANTLHRLLLYVYSDILENLCWENASELYVAADKYQIISLKSKCSTFLIANLTVNNVCEVLILANMHQDEDLKNAVQDYILRNDKAVFRSSEWKHLMDTHTKLAAETMCLKYYKN